MKYLIRHESIRNAVNNGRLHHQLIPMRLYYESDVSKTLVDYLKEVGHMMADNPGDGGFAAVTAIGALNDPEPFFDRRRVGSTYTLRLVNKIKQ